jgi:hypothetical protein
MRVSDVEEPRAVKRSSAFDKEIKRFRDPEVKKRLDELVAFRIDRSNDLFSWGKKDSVMSYPRGGYRHAHLVYGKAIVVYKIDARNLYLLLATDHKPLDHVGTGKSVDFAKKLEKTYDNISEGAVKRFAMDIDELLASSSPKLMRVSLQNYRFSTDHGTIVDVAPREDRVKSLPLSLARRLGMEVSTTMDALRKIASKTPVGVSPAFVSTVVNSSLGSGYAQERRNKLSEAQTSETLLLEDDDFFWESLNGRTIEYIKEPIGGSEEGRSEMRIRHLLENVDEFFWESLQDHGWRPRGEFLVSPDDEQIAVAKNRKMYYRSLYAGSYTDERYAELLRFDRDPEVQVRWCSRNAWLLKYASEAVQLAAVEQNGWAIKYIQDPSEAVQLASVQGDGFALQYIENPSEAVKIAAVRQNGWAIYYIRNPSEAVQLAAVRQDWYAIQHIENPSEAVQIAAVRQNCWAIQYIKNPSEAVQLAAVRENGRVIKHIKRPCEAVKRAMEREP